MEYPLYAMEIERLAQLSELQKKDDDTFLPMLAIEWR